MEKIIHLLVVDDDDRIRKLLTKYLSEHGFFVSSAKDAISAKQALDTFIFDLLIIDIMMPGESGIELTTSIRKYLETPIIMLTAMGEVSDRIKGLESGADDYIPKPFDPKELLLRIQTILKRTKQKEADKHIVKFGEFSFNINHKILKKNGQEILLTLKESELFSKLAEKPGQVLDRETLAATLGDVNERTIDVIITRIRNKIEKDAKKPLYLRTIRGEGYVFYNN